MAKDPNVERENERMRLQKIADQEAEIRQYRTKMDQAARSGHSALPNSGDARARGSSSGGGGWLAVIAIVVIALLILSRHG